MKTIGIDYSMTSPSICVHYGEEWSIRNCQFYFLTDRPKLEGKTNQFNGTLHPIHSCEEQASLVIPEASGQVSSLVHKEATINKLKVPGSEVNSNWLL